MRTQPYLIHALSPLHVGTGHSVDIIDLPIARERATGIPIVPGSGLKGALRSAERERLEQDTHLAIFGPETADASEHRGALVAGDARLLLLPVRSFAGTFAWVTSPLLLRLAQRDLEGSSGLPDAIPHVAEDEGRVTSTSCVTHEQKIYLEDLDMTSRSDSGTDRWANFFGEMLFGDDAEAHFTPRFVLVHDEVMTFLFETAMQIDTRVRLDPARGTVARGALWYEESLPPESVLVGVLAAEPSRPVSEPLSSEEILGAILSGARVIQLGGKETVGRGRCRMLLAGGAR